MTQLTKFSGAATEEDTKQCQDQLIGLSPCQKFVSGDSKSPSPSCCSELRKDYNKTKRCLCVIVKDRNEPKRQSLASRSMLLKP